jgi:hypothetical protein
MSNPIKYSTGTESLALKKGNFYIGTGDVGKGPTSSTGYYNGISPPSGGYTIYLNKETGGPSIYTASNDAQLISLTNSIAGQSYTTANECLVYFAGQTDKMVLNRNYEGIVTDGLILNLDAGFTPSYPKNGTTWYDISKTNNGTLTNGPTFSTDGWGSIVFDGSDDFVSLNGVNSSYFTINTWVKYNQFISNFQGYGIVSNNTSTSNGFMLYQSTDAPFNRAKIFVVTTSSGLSVLDTTTLLSTNIWYNILATYDGNDIKFYINGNFDVSTSKNGTVSPNPGSLILGKVSYNSSPFQGSISITQIYNRALSATEVLQNYNAQKGRFGL